MGPKFKRFRITHLNARKSSEALEELTLVRSREDMLIVTEVPTRDNTPTDIQGYTAIYETSSEQVEICAYIRDRSISLIEDIETHPSNILLTTTGNRRVWGFYQSPSKPLRLPEGIKNGTVIMGDFNARHDEILAGQGTNQRGIELLRWIKDNGLEEKGTDEATHEKGGKLDLILTKDTHTACTKIFYNGRIEHSDHTCQSAMISIPIPNIRTPTKIDYRRVNTENLRESFKNNKEASTVKELLRLFEKTANNLPRIKASDKNRLPVDILDARREYKRLMKSKESKIRQEARLAYRKAIREYTKLDIEKTLEEVQDPGFF